MGSKPIRGTISFLSYTPTSTISGFTRCYQGQVRRFDLQKKALERRGD